ncbi:hypothetical protein HPB47_020029, partial [Ixodes persulcatus]
NDKVASIRRHATLSHGLVCMVPPARCGPKCRHHGEYCRLNKRHKGFERRIGHPSQHRRRHGFRTACTLLARRLQVA